MAVPVELSPPKEDQAAGHDRARRWWHRPVSIDIGIALLLFLGAAVGGLSHWKRVTATGQPYYYQPYFEPAVMIACGKGFVVARPQVPAMVPFLWRQTDRFSCDSIGPDARLGTSDIYQVGSWHYLMLAVGLTWRLVGVSWNALGPLFATLFGATIACLFAIFRLAMGRILAVSGAIALSFSGLHLTYLPALRDYAKAPFTLALIFLLGLLVLRRPTREGVTGMTGTLAIAASYGAILGLGYGFRTDFLSDFPPFFVGLAGFMEGGLFRNIRLKVAAAAVCLLAFVVSAWPVISTLDPSRGCAWHVVVLGFARQFSTPLGVAAAPYEVNREYLDEFGYSTVTSYARRVEPGVGHIEYCSAEYDKATRAYALNVVKRFPADMVVRAYASMWRIFELPFTGRPPMDEGDAPRDPGWSAVAWLGPALVVAAVAILSATTLRLGLFLVFLLLYFGGLPVIQFDARHYFHLEFITWWAGAFVLQAAVAYAWRRSRSAPGSVHPADALTWSRAALVLTTMFAVLAVVLWTARLYQQATVRSLLGAYQAAPRDLLKLTGTPSLASVTDVRVAPHTDPEAADFVAVDVDRSRCGAHATVAFRYEEATRRPYSRIFDIGYDDAAGLTEIYMPVYERFERIEVSDAPEGCVDGVYRVRDSGHFGILLEAMLPPGWRHAPLYQRLAGGWFRG